MTFPSTNMAIKAESVLRRARLKCTTIPVPRHISSDCGIALRLAGEALDQAESLMSEGGVRWSRIVSVS